MWKLLTYTEVKFPLKPYTNEYILGIVENENGERLIVQVEKGNEISIGVEGAVKKSIGPAGEINKFFPGLTESYKDVHIGKIGIIGTGVMGTQITLVCAKNNFEVVSKTRSKENVKNFSKKIEQILSKNASKEDVDKLLKKIIVTKNLQDLSDVDIVIECIIENEDAKKKLFNCLENICSKKTIFATNTSSLSIDKIASKLNYPKRFIGIHFFNPVEKMQLVEIIKGRKTSKKTEEISKNFVKKMDKTSITINDSPGAVVNRLLFSLINEAGYMFEEGVASIEEIDNAMKLGAKHPMGPFELVDFIGIDVTYEILKTLNFSLKNFKAPAKIFQKMLREGKLGRKIGIGFYDYKKLEVSGK